MMTMTDADVHDLVALLARVDGPRDNPAPTLINDEQWRRTQFLAWRDIADQLGWTRPEVFEAVEELARWNREDRWTWVDADPAEVPPGTTCQLHEHIEGLDGPPVAPGRYRAIAFEGGWAWRALTDGTDFTGRYVEAEVDGAR